jgi:copper ion binding protein
MAGASARSRIRAARDEHVPRKDRAMSENQETVLQVEGMSCPSCVRHIQEALDDVDGVTAVDVRLAEGRVAVNHDQESASVGALIQALREAGYESSPTRNG